MDSAAAFDTVLVAPGEHVIGQVFVTDGVFLIGEDGPLETRLVPRPGAIGISRLACSLLSRPTQISGLWLEGFDDGGAIADYYCVDITVSGCVFTNNYTGILFDSDVGRITIINNTFVANMRAIDASGAATCRHNIIWDPAYGLEGTIVCNDVLRLEDVPLLWRPGNFSLDPQFCGPSDYHIAASSPCAPGNSPRGDNCDLIGALPVGCNPTATKESTWGGVKVLYRKP
jgi:parallel beta-helix repeat protein